MLVGAWNVLHGTRVILSIGLKVGSSRSLYYILIVIPILIPTPVLILILISIILYHTPYVLLIFNISCLYDTLIMVTVLFRQMQV